MARRSRIRRVLKWGAAGAAMLFAAAWGYNIAWNVGWRDAHWHVLLETGALWVWHSALSGKPQAVAVYEQVTPAHRLRTEPSPGPKLTLPYYISVSDTCRVNQDIVMRNTVFVRLPLHRYKAQGWTEAVSDGQA
jgi:hypothetical protein